MYTGLICFAVAALTIRYFRFEGNLACVWPANAIVLATLLVRDRRHWSHFLMSGFVAMTAAGVFEHGITLAPLLLAIANTVEVFAAAILLRGTVDADHRLLHRHSSVGRFVFVAGFVAPAIGAGLAVLSVAFTQPVPLFPAFATKHAADALSLLICTPFFYGLFNGDYFEANRGATFKERITRLAPYGLVVVVSWAVFWQDRLPLLFLPIVPLMLVAFRLGWLGTSVAVLLVAVIGGSGTFHGHGPISHSGRSLEIQLVFLQVYLATILLLMMPVAAALAARRDLIERLSESERSLTLLAERSAIVLLRFAADGMCSRVVGDAAAMIGRGSMDRVLTPLGMPAVAIDPPLGEALDGAHRRVMADPNANGGSVTVEIARPGGVWIEATFRADMDEQGHVTGSVAALVDVTNRKHREGELARRAETDELTGLANRSGFMRRFEALLHDPRVPGLSVAMIDVDRFKELNDNYGHVAGDAILAEIARRIAKSVRASDIVARLGGDEFVVVLATGDRTAAQEVCRRIVETVGSSPVELPLGGRVEARISCGVVHRSPGQDGMDLLNRADGALYAAKRGGRNRLIAV